MLLYKCLDIDNNDKKQLRSFSINKQNAVLIFFAILFSPGIIGVRYLLYKTGKLENKKFIALFKTIGFVLYSLYLICLIDQVAYLIVGMIAVIYLIYQYYIIGLEKEDDQLT